MNANVKYVVALIVIIITTCLTMTLNTDRCGTIFSRSCQRFGHYKRMVGLIATALTVLIFSLILTCISTQKSKKWILLLEIFMVGFSAILLFIALCIFFNGNRYWAPLMGSVAMTLAAETTMFMILDLFA